jgi:hypothetical protein
MRRWFRDPLFLLAVAAGLIALAVQSGDTGSADTRHRLQSTHAFWTSEPAVFPNEYPEFGVHGRGGRLQSWYGIGQSLLMLPSDVVGTYVEKLPVFEEYNGNDPTVRGIFVTYTVNIFLSVMTALVSFRFLRQLNFGTRQSVAGVVALLTMTTHLHYTQNMMENNYIFLLTLAGFSYQFEWLRTGSRRALVIGSGALGLNLLTRLTTGMDLVAAAVFVALVLNFEKAAGSEFARRAREYVWVALPVYVLFGLLDRLYQFYRFGSFFNTYAGVAAAEWRQRAPGLPASFPFSTPLHTGLMGALFTPEKSIFLFDPLLILMVVLAAVAWRRFSAAVKAYVVAMGLLLAAYLCFYARYFVWSGDSAWGDRYVSTTVELAVLLAVPLLLSYRRELRRAVWGCGLALMAVSAVIQAASVAFWLSLELYQMETLGHPTFVVWLRMKNIVAFAMGKMSAWGLTNVPMTQDPWDYVHITSWNFLAFQLARAGEAPGWVVDLAQGFWIAGLVALAGVLWRLCWVLRGAENQDVEKRGVMSVNGPELLGRTSVRG